jgi:LPS export ABC transporter protein LptC
VVLRQEAGVDALRLNTERLRVAADADLVESDVAVVLRSGNWHFSAGGLRADLGQQHIELLDRVEGVHE